MRGAQSRPLQTGGLLNRAGCLQRLALAEVCPPACRTAPLQSFSTRISALPFSPRHTLPKESPSARTTNLRHLNCSSSRWKQLTGMDNSAPGGGRPRTSPDVHPSTQKYFDRLANRKKAAACGARWRETKSRSLVLTMAWCPISIPLISFAWNHWHSRTGILRSNFHVSHKLLPPADNTCDGANINRYSALSLLVNRPLKGSGAAQPQEASPSAGNTSKVIHTTETDGHRILGETPDQQCSPVEAHRASLAASKTEAQPNPLPVDDKETETISSVAQTKTPKPPNDQAQNRPGQYETESNGTNTGQRREDSTEAPRIKDGGPVRKGRQFTWTNGGDDLEREDDDEDGGAGKWQQPASKTLDQHARMFACPFYKRYPNCDDLPKACNKGWPSYHRTKLGSDAQRMSIGANACQRTCHLLPPEEHRRLYQVLQVLRERTGVE